MPTIGCCDGELGDAIRLWRRREQLPAETYASRRTRLLQRLDELIETPWTNKEARRLIKRLRRHRNDLLTFLNHANIPFETTTLNGKSDPRSSSEKTATATAAKWAPTPRRC